MDLSFDKVSDSQTVLHLDGRLDIETAAKLKAMSRKLIDDGTRDLIIDMQGVSFVDSSGLSAVVSALKYIREHEGKLKLASVGDQPRTALSLTLLDRILDIYPSVDEATLLN